MGQRVVAVLDALAAHASKLKVLQVDNGPEFILKSFFSKALDAWAHQNEVHLAFSRPGMPTDNPYIEAFKSYVFNGRLRQECLNQHWFLSLDEASAELEAWRVDYNTERPHSALGLQTPDQFVKERQLKAAKRQEI